SRYPTTRAVCGGRPRAMGIDDVRRQEARRTLHAHLPPIQRRVEDRSRSHFIEPVGPVETVGTVGTVGTGAILPNFRYSSLSAIVPSPASSCRGPSPLRAD